MKNKKSLYVGYTEEEVRRMESKYYTIQFGGDFLSQDNCYIFTQKEITTLYNDTMNDLLDIIEDGNEKDRKYALNLLLGFVALPMRLH